jgi:hypothetical protein
MWCTVQGGDGGVGESGDRLRTVDWLLQMAGQYFYCWAGWRLRLTLA